jgi:formylglycine-generating enzyme required for sulfatase activity
MTRIFISYRRDDTAGYALFLHYLLEAHFGIGQVFLDVDDILLATDFRRAIDDAVESCAVLIALIGRQWLPILDRRRDEPNDFVRLEIATALNRRIPVIPALIDGAAMPTEGALPEPIKALAWQNGLHLSHERFRTDVDHLIEQIEEISPPALPFEPQTVLIPAGPFLMGSDRSLDRHADTIELPPRLITLPDYRIGKYPVTVAEYRAFIDAGGYSNRQWWTNAGWRQREQKHWTEPRFWHNPLWTGDHRLPVVGVSWHEAYAYCRWLAHVTGRPYRLPTEAEWEKAARGPDGRIWPWGSDWRAGLCNTFETNVGHTTPVGQFSPDGDSPYRAADMAGNVLEWCLSKGVETYQFPEDNEPEDEAERVLRGGSWYIQQQGARAACRYFSSPDVRNDTRGFRCFMAVLK